MIQICEAQVASCQGRNIDFVTKYNKNIYLDSQTSDIQVLSDPDTTDEKITQKWKKIQKGYIVCQYCQIYYSFY